MISTGTKDFDEWTQKEQVFVRDQFLNGDGLDKIGKNCHRHAKNVCIELIRQGLIQENTSSHIRFETPYNLRYARKVDTDTSSEYTPSENLSDDSDSDASEIESEIDYDSDYTPSVYDECENIIMESSNNSHIKDNFDPSDFDLYNISQQVDIVFEEIYKLKNYLKSFVK